MASAVGDFQPQHAAGPDASLPRQGKKMWPKRGKHPKSEHHPEGADLPVDEAPPQNLTVDMMSKSQESRPAKKPRKKRGKNGKAGTDDTTLPSSTENAISANDEQSVRGIAHQEQTWDLSGISAEQRGVTTQPETRLPTSQSESHKEENGAQQHKPRKNNRRNKKEKKEKATAGGDTDLGSGSLTPEEWSKLSPSDLLEAEFGNRAKVLSALRSASASSPTPPEPKTPQLPTPSQSPAPRRRKRFVPFSADQDQSSDYRSRRGWLSKEERKQMSKNLKKNEKAQLYLAPHLRHSDYIKRQLNSPPTPPKSPSKLIDPNGWMDPDTWARENGWGDDSEPFGTQYDPIGSIVKGAQANLPSKRDKVVTSLQLRTSPEPEQWNGRSKWARVKILKPEPPKPDSNAWGSDTEHGAASAHPNADPEADVRQLVDWEGNWLPAPVDWEIRRGYRNQNLYTSLDTWMIKTEEAGGNVTIDATAEPMFLDIKNSEIAARCWIPETIDGQAPQTWWQPYITTKIAVEEGVDPETKPWWTLYITNQSNVLMPWEVPDAKLDPTDENYSRAEQDSGSHGACLREQWKDNRKKERKALAKAPSAKLSEFKKANGYKERDPAIVPADGGKEPIRTRVNMYLRPAYEVDAQQVLDIYNWHIDHTCHVADLKPYSLDQIKERLAGIKSALLPAIVAVEKSTQKNNPHLRRQNRAAYPPPPEQIIGFAWADDYHAMQDSAYRYTADMEIFIRPDFRQRGVASCLLDKLLFCLDPDHRCRGGYEWVTEKYLYAGGERVISKVLSHIPFEVEQQDRLVFLDRWLGQHGFRKVGEIPEIGVKNGKILNTAIFWLKTGSPLNPYAL